MTKTVFFDLDGTLTDPKKGITTCIQYALKKLDVDVPAQDDLTWCIANGMKTIGVTYGYGSKQELLQAGANKIVSQPAELNSLPVNTFFLVSTDSHHALNTCYLPVFELVNFRDNWRAGRQFDRVCKGHLYLEKYTK